MPRMSGLQLSDPTVVAQLSPQDRRGIAAALGANLAATQALTWPFPGDYAPEGNTIRPPPTSYHEHLRRALTQRLDRARGYNDRTTPVAESFAPCFVMTDYVEQWPDGGPDQSLKDPETANVRPREAGLAAPALPAPSLIGCTESEQEPTSK